MKISWYLRVAHFVILWVFSFGLAISFAQDAANTKKIKAFLLAGQSNIEGQGQITQLQQLLCAVDEYSILNGNCYNGLPIFNRLFETITDFYRAPGNPNPQYDYDPQLAENSANALSKLYKQNMFRVPLLKPLATVNMVSVEFYGRTSEGKLNQAVLRYGRLEPKYGYTDEKFGPELLIGHWLRQNMGSDILLIKVAQGGSDLYEQWRSPTMAQKLPPTNVESLYPKLIEWTNTITQNLPSYFPEYNGYNLEVRIQGLFWFQGFNDMFNDEFIRTYQENLTDLIGDVRHDLSSPGLPVALATDANNSSWGVQIQQAQQQIAGMLPHINYTPTRDLSAYYHYDSAAYIIIGKRLAESMWNLLPCSAK